MVASWARITKEITDMYKKQVCFIADLHRIYLKPRSVETKDWYTRSYRMSQMDIEEILKEWLEEWRNPTKSSSDSEDVTRKHAGKGKDKQDEGKSTEKQPKTEKRLAPQIEPAPHARKKRKVGRQPCEPNLSTEDYEHIATSVQETMEESMTTIVTS